MDVDQPQGGNGQGNGNGPDYVYFERHPERYESARQKSTGVRMRLELWYKEGVEGAVERRERSVPTSEFHLLCDAMDEEELSGHGAKREGVAEYRTGWGRATSTTGQRRRWICRRD